jgi:argininosuccinate lyase
MTDPLWKKAGGSQGPDEAVMQFLAGEDVVLDAQLIEFDILASQAHARGLAAIGVLAAKEAEVLVSALSDIGSELAAGERRLDARFEDGHSALEAWLTERLGPLGAKIHAGRSRNDQVAVALRLFLKDRLISLGTQCEAIADALLERAMAQPDLPMPGYTHLQRAMPSSTGLWLAGHAECFIDNASLAASVRDWLDASPLGTASGFGVNLPLARESAAKELGFARLVINPQCAQNSRGKVELQALAALAAAMADLRRLAWDLSLFTSAEFDFVRLPDRWCTGSSIMPNKRNPDVVELMRAAYGVVAGARVELESVLSLPSGYQRDLQATKPPTLRAFGTALLALALAPALVRDLAWNETAMSSAISGELFATDLSVDLALEGVPFREAYRQVGERLDELGPGDTADSLQRRVSPGACGDLRLDELRSRLESITGLF